MSKFNPSMFNVAAFPTFRLYSEPKKFIEFTEKEFDIKTLRKWLKEFSSKNKCFIVLKSLKCVKCEEYKKGMLKLKRIWELVN